jgi:hypothetical protein
MIHTVCCGILLIKELEKVKREEVEWEVECVISGWPSLMTSFGQIPNEEWNAMFPESLLFNPLLLVNLGAFDGSCLRAFGISLG